MATNIWLGQQKATAQVGTFTVTADDVLTTFSITIGTVKVSILGSGVSAAQTATNLIAALQACTAGMFTEITWASGGSAIIQGTANTAGMPFTAVSSVSGGAGTIGSYTAVTANTSPNDVNDAVNWSNAAVPGAGDTLWIDGRTSQSLLWNLSALSAVAVTAINVSQAFPGQIGLKETNSAGTAYTEYRPINWQIQFTTCNIGYGTGSGSGLIKIDPGSATASTVNVYNTGSPIETGRQAVSLLGTNASNVLNVWGGSVGTAARGGDVATYATINCGPAQAASPPTVVCGVGSTLTTVSNDNGTLTINSALTTLNHKGGTTTILGSGAITTINVSAGTLSHQGTGTVTNFNVTGATVNMSDQAPGITLTHVTLGPNTNWYDRGYRGTYTNGVVLTALARLSGGQNGNVVVDWGPGRTITPS